jgi:hypothetical protein
MPSSHDSADSICSYNVGFFIPTIVIYKYDYNSYLKLWLKMISFYKLLANFNNCLYYILTHSIVSCLRVFNYNYIYSSLCTLYNNIYKRFAVNQEFVVWVIPHVVVTPIKQSVHECQVEYICYFLNFCFNIRFNGNLKYS